MQSIVIGAALGVGIHTVFGEYIQKFLSNREQVNEPETKPIPALLDYDIIKQMVKRFHYMESEDWRKWVEQELIKLNVRSDMVAVRAIYHVARAEEQKHEPLRMACIGKNKALETTIENIDTYIAEIIANIKEVTALYTGYFEKVVILDSYLLEKKQTLSNYNYKNPTVVEIPKIEPMPSDLTTVIAQATMSIFERTHPLYVGPLTYRCPGDYYEAIKSKILKHLTELEDKKNPFNLNDTIEREIIRCLSARWDKLIYVVQSHIENGVIDSETISRAAIYDQISVKSRSELKIEAYGIARLLNN